MTNTHKPEISIIFPTYNERENIVDLISETSLYLTNHVAKPFEFIVVDDDSPDKTWQVVENKFSVDSKVRVIRKKEGRGLATAIYRGIQEAKGNIVVWMDCDFSMPPYKIAELINKVYDGYDVCVGSRFIQGGRDVRGPADSWIAVILSGIMNNFIALVLRHHFKDYTSGFVAAKKSVFNEVKIEGDYGEYFIDFIYHCFKKGYKVIEVPYFCVPRRAGLSKTGSNLFDYLRKGLRYVSLTLKLRFGHR